jgi:hypothetical protein
MGVIAGGAMVDPLIGGLPLLSVCSALARTAHGYDAIGLRHAFHGPRGYLVPRVNVQTIAGTTMENVGYDRTPRLEGLKRVRPRPRRLRRL